jgi:hypothetical protein
MAHKQEVSSLADCLAEVIIGHLESEAAFNCKADRSESALPDHALGIDTVAVGLTTILLFDGGSFWRWLR